MCYPLHKNIVSPQHFYLPVYLSILKSAIGWNDQLACEMRTTNAHVRVKKNFNYLGGFYLGKALKGEE